MALPGIGQLNVFKARQAAAAAAAAATTRKPTVLPGGLSAQREARQGLVTHVFMGVGKAEVRWTKAKGLQEYNNGRWGAVQDSTVGKFPAFFRSHERSLRTLGAINQVIRDAAASLRP